VDHGLRVRVYVKKALIAEEDLINMG